MLRLTLAQMRRSLGRLVAAGIAIAIGTAFVAATLLAGNVLTRTGYDAVTLQFGQADLVAQGPIDDATLTKARAVPGVQAAEPLTTGGVYLTAGNRSSYEMVLGVAADERLRSVGVSNGRTPSAHDEIALAPTTAERLGVAVGDTVSASYSVPPADPDAVDAQWEEKTAALRVVGLVDDPDGAWRQYGGVGLATTEDIRAWSAAGPDDPIATTLLVATADGSEQTREALATALPDTTVLTKDEAAARTISEFSQAGNVLVTVVLGFAAVALLVAALVIANTFQVLVAQRTRTLALLRCVGALRGQVRRSVVVEAAILGFGASAVGLLTGSALAQVALAVLNRSEIQAPLPATITLTWAAVLVPLVVGTLVTVLASLVPARAATRVSPVEALRPADAPEASSRAGRVRLVLSLLLAVGGGLALLGTALGAATGAADPMVWLGLGVLSGATSFVGVLIGAVLWVPAVVRVAGGLLQRAGSTARLAAANTVRNPRRTAATSTALLIGVTLVAMMSTGAATARTSLSRELSDRYAVDVQLSSYGEPVDAAAMDAARAAVAGVEGVREVQPVRTVQLLAGERQLEVVTMPDPRTLVRDERTISGLSEGRLVLPSSASVVARNDTPLTTTDGTPVRVTTAASNLGGSSALADTVTFDAIDPDAPVSGLWVRLDDGVNAANVSRDIQDVLPSGAPLGVESAAAERQGYEQVIDTMLAVVVGLLAVAVVIALVGVTNTLSLSVIERQRESATLRAIGLTRRQLRSSLAVEGALITGVGAALGVVLGLAYGWAGAATVFGSAGHLHLDVPWRDLTIVLAVALLAGLAASVLPARRATRTSPVAALAVD